MAIAVEAHVVGRAPRLGLGRRVRHGLRLAGQFALLVLLFQAGTVLVRVTALPLPGNLVGMLILLALLHLGVVRLRHVQDVADLALKRLNFFFVPFAVGLMTWTGLLAASGVALAISFTGGMITCLAVTGLIGQYLSARGGGPDDA